MSTRELDGARRCGRASIWADALEDRRLQRAGMIRSRGFPTVSARWSYHEASALGSASLQALLGLDLPRVDGRDERLVVASVLLSVGLRELDDRLIEGGPSTQVGGDRNPVAAAGVRAGEGPAAQPAVGGHALRHHLPDLCRALPVLQLPPVEVPALFVDPGVDVEPAEEYVTARLHQV